MIYPKRRKPAPLGVRSSPQIRCSAHRAWIRGHQCSVFGRESHACLG
jgi:hypothetical protein